MNILDLRLKTGMSRSQFSKYFKIPYRTLEDWEKGKSKCSKYLLLLIEYKLNKEGLL